MPTSPPPKRSISLLQHRKDIAKRKQRKKQKKRSRQQQEEETTKPPVDEQPPKRSASYKLVKAAQLPKFTPEKKLESKETPRNKNVVSERSRKRGKKESPPSDAEVPLKKKAAPAVTRTKTTTSKRKRSEKQPDTSKPALVPEPEEQWTELTAVGHIFADEVSQYQQFSTNLSSGERRQLSAWSESVQAKLSTTSRLVMENINLVSELRQTESRVKGLQDESIALRMQTRLAEESSQKLEAQVNQQEQTSSTLIGASSFLSALENLSAVCQERGVTKKVVRSTADGKTHNSKGL